MIIIIINLRLSQKKKKKKKVVITLKLVYIKHNQLNNNIIGLLSHSYQYYQYIK